MQSLEFSYFSLRSSPLSWNGQGSGWVQIASEGYYYNEGKWATNRMIENGGKQKAIIPKSLAPGEYLVRFDFIALHMGGSVWSPGSEAGSQWYPRCAQIKVTGNGNVKLPSGVAIPGLYTKDTPGVVQDIFSNPGKAGKNYIVPGKQIAVLFSKYYGFDADSLGLRMIKRYRKLGWNQSLLQVYLSRSCIGFRSSWFLSRRIKEEE